jgi:hypothetical protein
VTEYRIRLRATNGQVVTAVVRELAADIDGHVQPCHTTRGRDHGTPWKLQWIDGDHTTIEDDGDEDED